MTMTLVQAQEIDKLAIKLAVAKQLNDYPESTLQDVYKAFYQEYFGPEHMITDTAAVANYLSQELEAMGTERSPLYYEPIGINGDYVRVHLTAVTDGKITASELLDAFINSASVSYAQRYDWETLWKAIAEVIDDVKPGFGTNAERKQLAKASHDSKAVHHSRAYNAAYHPHYRIVERSTFEMLLKPSIDR